MNDRVSQLTNEISEHCAYLDEICVSLRGLQTVSHIKQSKFPITWVGGIPGAIKEIRQNKRLGKLINAPIVKDKSFFQLAFEIVDTTKLAVDKQIELQSICNQSTADYYENTIRIVHSSERCFQAWYEYSPDMAVEEIQKDANLYNTVHTIYEEFRRMQLPEELTDYAATNSNNGAEKSGCLGTLLVLISISLSFLGLSVYGISLLI